MSSTAHNRDARDRTFSRIAMGRFGIIALGTILGGSSAPTPLYRLYQEHWGLSHVMLTTIFAAYALSLLVALLTIGSLSDYVGRRPAIISGLLLSAVAMAVFFVADSPGWLLGARVVQGLATGAAISALSALILDTQGPRGALINSVAPFIGMSIGALGSSALAAYAPAPTQLVYAVFLVAFIGLAILIVWMPETTAKRPGALASLRPHIAVPPQAKRALLMVTPVNIAVWALGGFYLSLMPSLLREATGITSPFLSGIVVATLTLSGAAGVWLWREWHSRRILITGATCLIAGVVVTLAGTYTHQVAVMMIGTVIAGFGFGPGFFGAARTILPLAEPGERAGLLSAFFVQSYLAFSLPAILVSLFIPRLGLALATDVYGAAIIALALISLVATLISVRRAKVVA